ncbi:MAG: hypothetical protein GX552_00135 [Chloroflexi bacterium]|nr:hypothetical protein [Chloroflexota bacterium]
MKFGKVAAIVAGGIGALAVIGWLGLRVPSGSYPPPGVQTRDLGSVEIPADLPAPVRRYLVKVAGGEQMPRIESAMFWGQAQMRVGLWMPARFRAYSLAGRAFRREMQVTWFGLPVMLGIDQYVGGVGSMNIAGRVVTGYEVDQGANLIPWAEAPLTPSVLITDPRIRWEPISDTAVSVIIPFGEEEDRVRFDFDPETGLVARASALRYREPGGERVPWWGDYLEWKEFNGVLIPSRFSVTWGDEGTAWSYWNIEGMEFNVDVSEALSGK